MDELTSVPKQGLQFQRLCWSPLRFTQVHSEIMSASLPEALPAPFRGVRVCKRRHVRQE